MRLVIDLPDQVADALGREARRLLLRRRAYVRSLLAAVAAAAAAEVQPQVVPAKDDAVGSEASE